VVAFAHLPVYILPGPRAVAEALLDRYPSLLNSLWITAEEAAGGLVASIVAGVAIALIFAQLRWFRQLVFPYTILLQTVPIVAIAPLIINWVGAGIFAVTIVTFIICLAPIIANTTQGLISVDENLIHLFLMYKATPAQILFRLRLPNALPNLFTGIRISAGISVIGGLTGELFAGSTRVGEGGLGYAIIYANNQMETAYLFALVVAATALGFSFFFIVMFFEWLALHNWHESSRPQTAE
jgi:NitT/TauT family transport system permease protein